jgi:1,4-alpha-glucan branching enzyme
MARQRWYAGKGGVPRLRTVGDIPLPSPDHEALVHILLFADDADPRRAVYQVPVVERRGVPEGAERHLIGPNGDRAVLDGPYDPAPRCSARSAATRIRAAVSRAAAC